MENLKIQKGHTPVLKKADLFFSPIPFSHRDSNCSKKLSHIYSQENHLILETGIQHNIQ